MIDENQKSSTRSGVFTEAEYRTDVKNVVAHAIATGRGIVARADGTVRVVISIPRAEPSAKPMTTKKPIKPDAGACKQSSVQRAVAQFCSSCCRIRPVVTGAQRRP